MSACEACWRTAGGDPDYYRTLLRERNCTPEDQAGPEATVCVLCGRRTVHQHTGECMFCGRHGGDA